MQTVDYPVLPFSLVVYRSGFRIIDAQAHARFDKHAVYFVAAHDRHWRQVRHGNVVESAHCWPAESPSWRLGEVVILARLVVDLRDPADCVGAESVLHGGIGVPARIRERR